MGNKIAHPTVALGLVALSAAALTAACAAGQGPGRQAARTGHPAHQAAAHRPRPALSPVSAGFISASTGWLLARPPCAARGCAELRLRQTTDGGRHWLTVPAPPAPFWNFTIAPGNAVSQIMFASARDGWAFGPGLWATHDGARTWHRVRVHGTAVMSMAAGGGRVIAAFGRCPENSPCRFTVYAARMGGDRWRPVPGSAVTGLSAESGLSPAPVLISGRTGFVIADQPPARPPVLLAGPADGSGRWHRISVPHRICFSAPLAVAPGGRIVLGCGAEPGAGQQRKHAYLSLDQGRTWRRLADPPSSGYLTQASATARGTIFLSGGRSDVYISRNGGRTWQTSRSLRSADIGDGLAATAVTSREAFVLQASLYAKQIWFSYDDGRTWSPVTVR